MDWVYILGGIYLAGIITGWLLRRYLGYAMAPFKCKHKNCGYWTFNPHSMINHISGDRHAAVD